MRGILALAHTIVGLFVSPERRPHSIFLLPNSSRHRQLKVRPVWSRQPCWALGSLDHPCPAYRFEQPVHPNNGRRNMEANPKVELRWCDSRYRPRCTLLGCRKTQACARCDRADWRSGSYDGAALGIPSQKKTILTNLILLMDWCPAAMRSCGCGKVTTRAVGAVGGPSYAHPKRAVPNTDAVVSSSPTEIWLSFNESLAV